MSTRITIPVEFEQHNGYPCSECGQVYATAELFVHHLYWDEEKRQYGGLTTFCSNVRPRPAGKFTGESHFPDSYYEEEQQTGPQLVEDADSEAPELIPASDITDADEIDPNLLVT